jgi:ABC-type glycerol-3-phosphate transport system permease component
VISKLPRSLAALVRMALWLLYGLPLLWVVVTSVKSNADILRAPNALLFRPTFGTIREVFSSVRWPILMSLQISVITTVLVLVVAVPAAYALGSRGTPAWRRVAGGVLTAFLLLQMIPQPMTVIPLYSVLAQWHLAGTVAGLLLADVALFVPFAVLLLRPYVQAIPHALSEAAMLDGASRFQTFRLVHLPLLVNGVLTLASVVFVLSWGEFIYAINFLSDPSQYTVSATLAEQTTVYAANWNRLMALALVTSLPILLVFMVSQRRLVRGLALGAIK